jgi:hypothetical protein
MNGEISSLKSLRLTMMAMAMTTPMNPKTTPEINLVVARQRRRKANDSLGISGHCVLYYLIYYLIILLSIVHDNAQPRGGK